MSLLLAKSELMKTNGLDVEENIGMDVKHTIYLLLHGINSFYTLIKGRETITRAMKL